MKDYPALSAALLAWRSICVHRYGAGWRRRRAAHYGMLRDYRAEQYRREWSVFIGCPFLGAEVS